jgi:hypothetical protein
MPTLEITAGLRNTSRESGLSSTQSVTTTGEHRHALDLTVGTTEETLIIHADITAGQGPGWCHLENLDADNYVQIGIATGAYFARLAPGDCAVLPLDAALTTLYLLANTAAVLLSIDIRER